MKRPSCFIAGFSGTQSATESKGAIIITGRKAQWLREFTNRHGGSIDDTLELLAAGALYADGIECEPQDVTIRIKAGTPLARIVAVNLALAPEIPIADLLQGWIDDEARGHCEQPENLMLPAKHALPIYRNRQLREAMAKYDAGRRKPANKRKATAKRKRKD